MLVFGSNLCKFISKTIPRSVQNPLQEPQKKVLQMGMKNDDKRFVSFRLKEGPEFIEGHLAGRPAELRMQTPSGFQTDERDKNS